MQLFFKKIENFLSTCSEAGLGENFHEKLDLVKIFVWLTHPFG
jgi:hypothetical protein